jgi:hypothetical protein
MLASIACRYLAWREQVEMRCQLSNLSDRELADMGTPAPIFLESSHRSCRTARMSEMHIYPIHDVLMVLAGGIYGVAVMAAIEDINRVRRTSEKDRV